MFIEIHQGGKYGSGAKCELDFPRKISEAEFWRLVESVASSLTDDVVLSRRDKVTGRFVKEAHDGA